MNIEKPEIGTLTGDVPLTPVQQWFFSKDWNNIHHFNQSALFEVKVNIALQMLKSIFNVVAQYHDVFRMRYKLQNGKYVQSYTDNLFLNVEERTLKSTDEEKFTEELYGDATIIQNGLNIFDGPVVQVVLYRCPDKKDRVLVVAHHLVVDGVSWRILIDDMEMIYDDFMHNGRIALPAKTHSYRQWANALLEYAKSETCQKEVSYWQNIENLTKETFLIPDCEKESEENEYLTISLNEKETSDLIHEVPKKYDSHINDVLLTALTLAVGDLSNNYESSFTLEGHGREDVIGLDISRTIGWFTSIFPVFLKITDPKDLIGCINEVKTALRKIPNKGIGYGIIRYCADKLSKPLPKISFNYLGQWDAGTSEEGIFRYVKESSGDNEDPKKKSYYLIDINGSIKNFIFKMRFAYRVDSYKPETIEKFANQFKGRLLDMIGN